MNEYSGFPHFSYIASACDSSMPSSLRLRVPWQLHSEQVWTYETRKGPVFLVKTSHPEPSSNNLRLDPS